jgi:hypothetical protein
VGKVGIPRFVRDFQGRWEGRKTCFWFSSLSTARLFPQPVRFCSVLSTPRFRSSRPSLFLVLLFCRRFHHVITIGHRSGAKPCERSEAEAALSREMGSENFPCISSAPWFVMANKRRIQGNRRADVPCRKSKIPSITNCFCAEGLCRGRQRDFINLECLVFHSAFGFVAPD